MGPALVARRTDPSQTEAPPQDHTPQDEKNVWPAYAAHCSGSPMPLSGMVQAGRAKASRDQVWPRVLPPAHRPGWSQSS